METYKETKCNCNNCKCNTLSKAKEIKEQKIKAIQGNKTIKKTIMPNGNIHFTK